MIIVSSLEHAKAAFEKYEPRYVVSVLEAIEATPPTFSSLAPENHVKLIGDCARPEQTTHDNEHHRCDALVGLAERWLKESDPKPAILIHCNEGAARSMAVAYILMCAIEKKTAEKEIAARLRAAAPHADPNLMLVSEADVLLGRDDRMIEAVLDLSPACASVNAPVVTLPVAA